MSRYILACPDHRLAALDASGVRSLHPASLRRGACGLLRCVPLEDTDTVPAEVEACPLCEVVTLDGTGGWAERQHDARWAEHLTDTVWAGTEKAVLVPVADGTPEHVAHLPAGWAACEYLDGSRLVRYIGTKPAALASYPTLYAADVASLLGGA